MPETPRAGHATPLKGDFIMAPTFATQKASFDDANNVRKALEGFLVLRKKAEGKAIPDALSGADGQPIDLKAEGFFPVGMVTTDGFTLNRGRETEGVEAFGYADEVRVDTTKAPKTISTVALEADKRELLEMVLGQDLSAVQADANGEVVFDEVSIPLDIEYDAVLLTRDVQKANGADYFRGCGFPRLALTGDSEESLNASSARETPLEFRILTDNELGTPIRHYMFGEGFRITEQGFKAAVGG